MSESQTKGKRNNGKGLRSLRTGHSLWSAAGEPSVRAPAVSSPGPFQLLLLTVASCLAKAAMNENRCIVSPGPPVPGAVGVL